MIELRGEIDEWSLPSCDDVIAFLETRHGDLVTVDAAHVTFASSALLRRLLELRRVVATNDGRFELATVSPVLRRVLEITGLADPLNVTPACQVTHPSA